MSRDVTAFLESFALPLVRGGDVVIDAPVSYAALVALEQHLPHASVPIVAIDEARTAVVSELVVHPPPFVFDADELALTAALHNLLFLVHPRANTWLATDRQLDRVLDTAQAFAERPLATDRTTLLARHGLLHNVFDVTRTDTTLIWWTGKAEYLGQRPPARLTRWPSLRRLREETSVTGYDHLLGTPEVAEVVAALMRRSPLTWLLTTAESAPPLDWRFTVGVLRHAELARAVAYHGLPGADASDIATSTARYAEAFDRMLHDGAPETDIRAVTAFLMHLHALLAVAESGMSNLDAPSPALSRLLSPEYQRERPRGVVTFLALPEACRRVDPRLAEPPGLADDAAFARRWAHHRGQVLRGLEKTDFDELAAKLSQHLLSRPVVVS